MENAQSEALKWSTITCPITLKVRLTEEASRVGVPVWRLIEALLLKVDESAKRQVDRLLAPAHPATVVSGGEEFVSREDRTPAGRPLPADQVRRARREYEHRSEPD